MSQDIFSIYRVKKPHMGKVLILSNIHFERSPNRDPGGITDEEQLTNLFLEVGFTQDQVVVCRDRTADQMLEKIQETASSVSSELGCFVLCVLSHGEYEDVRGVDENKVQIWRKEDNRSIVHAITECANLAGKPKLLMFHCCQGRNPILAEQFDGNDIPASEEVATSDVAGESTVRTGTWSIRLADFLIIQSTPPDYRSIRAPRGSPFIGEFIRQCEKSCNKMPLQDLVSKVNRKFEKKVCRLKLNEGEVVNSTVVSYSQSTLSKSFYLCDTDEVIKNLTLARSVNKEYSEGETLLMRAVEGENMYLTRKIIKSGDNVNEANSRNGDTALLVACGRNFLSFVQILIESGAVVDQANFTGFTPLLTACKHDYGDILIYLLDREADIEKADEDGMTPLHAACANGHEEVAKRLLEFADRKYRSDQKKMEDLVDRTDAKGRTALFVSSSNGHLDLVRLLIQYDADVNVVDQNNRSPLLAACIARNTEIAEILINYGSEIKIKDNKGKSPLLTASENGLPAVVELLLKTDELEVNEMDNYNNYPLTLAALYGFENTVTLLLEHKADIEVTDIDGDTALLCATYKNSINTVETLLAYGADIYATNNLGRSALTVAIRKERLEIVEMFANTDNINPLYEASRIGAADVVRMLLKKNLIVHIDLQNEKEKNKTALMLAAENGNKDVLSVLVDEQADLELKDRGGNTALMRAVKKNQLETTKLLLMYGADSRTEDKKARGLLFNATLRRHVRMCNLLKEEGVIKDTLANVVTNLADKIDKLL